MRTLLYMNSIYSLGLFCFPFQWHWRETHETFLDLFDLLELYTHARIKKSWRQLHELTVHVEESIMCTWYHNQPMPLSWTFNGGGRCRRWQVTLWKWHLHHQQQNRYVHHNRNISKNYQYKELHAFRLPLARNVKYQYANCTWRHNWILPNVWRPLEKAPIISFTEPFILFVRMQWKTRTRCKCFSEESRWLPACRTENDRLSGLSSLLLGNRMERECICLRVILLELLEMYS